MGNSRPFIDPATLFALPNFHPAPGTSYGALIASGALTTMAAIVGRRVPGKQAFEFHNALFESNLLSWQRLNVAPDFPFIESLH
jgi:hypothetical protein